MTQLDMTPGAQIPRTDVGPQTAATQALSSAAYRDGSFRDLGSKLGATLKDGRFALFEPSVGEAFSRAVIDRTLPAKRLPLVPSFGTDVRMVVEHCLAAQELRNARDRQLSLVTLVCGLLFLPGTLIWLVAFQIRAVAKKKLAPLREKKVLTVQERRLSAEQSFFSTLALLAAAGLALLFAIRPPIGGPWSLYVRLMMVAPVVGWFIAKRICLRSTIDLRSRWSGLLEGGVVAATVPKAVPRDDLDRKAADLRASLERLTAEQETNIQHYAGKKGLLGVGMRWVTVEMNEDLRPAAGHAEFRTFHRWDLAKKIAERLNGAAASELPGGTMPHVSVQHWVVQDLPEGADEIGRPGTPEMDGYRMRDFGIQQIANRQTIGTDTDTNVVAQLVLHNGQVVATVVVKITILGRNLRVSAYGHALGPLNGLFTGKPKPKEVKVPKTGKFWEERTIILPLVDDDEVVRQAVRAPFMRIPGLLTWLGGSLVLPEPFCLRQAWADPTWARRAMSDSVLYSAQPLFNAVQAATIDFLADHDVDVERFTTRSNVSRAENQGVRPFKADVYDAG